MTFSDVVESIKSLSIEEKREIQLLSIEEKREIQLLLNQYLREERREEIFENFQLAQVEQKEGGLKFSSDISELKQLIEED